MTERVTLTVTEAAEYLGVSRNSAYQAVHRGEIPSVKIGKRFLIPLATLEKMLSGDGKPGAIPS